MAIFTNFKGGIIPKKSSEELITVTSALPYVNGVKHLGNIAGSLLPADIFHRFLDVFGVKNIFICGTDEHGAQTELAALQENVEPKAYSEKYYKIQKDIYKRWNFDFTFFGRTSSQTHHKLVQKMFANMNKKGFIKKGDLNLPFCRNDKIFLPDRYVEGTCPNCGYESARGDQCENCSKILDPVDLKTPRCAICGENKIEFRKQKHLFLELQKLAPDLERWITKQRHWPPNTSAIAMSWLKEGLRPRCITRNLKWGIKVPLKGYTNLVFYVWYEAATGYISMTIDGAKDKEAKKKIGDWKKWWTNGAKVYQFMGKDNVPFHTIFWPAILLAAKGPGTDFVLAHEVAGYEYLNWESQKFSTSRKIGLFSDRALDLFPTDYWRYYLASILPEKKDSNFEWRDFQARINNELLANYGNVFYRITSFISQHFQKVPRIGNAGKPEEELKRTMKEGAERVEKLVRKVRLKEAVQEVMTLSDALNTYFQVKEPWFAIRNKATKKDAQTTLYHAVNALVTVTTLLHPIIPSTAQVALEALGIKRAEKSNLTEFKIRPGAKVRALVLFQKIEDEELENAKKMAGK